MQLDVSTQNTGPLVWALSFFIVCCGVFVLVQAF